MGIAFLVEKRTTPKRELHERAESRIPLVVYYQQNISVRKEVTSDVF